MTDEAIAKSPTVIPCPAEDLSRQIEQLIGREADENVRAAQLFGDFYRCNWWVEDKKSSPFWLITGTIRRSQFLRVTKTIQGLSFGKENSKLPPVSALAQPTMANSIHQREGDL